MFRLKPLFLFVTAVCLSIPAVAERPLVMVVMDPLSKPLSCDCVQGYAQREYKLLGEHLTSALGREVKVVWFESLAEALSETDGAADLVIGKHSVVLADEKSTAHALRPVAQLTGKMGEVSQHGLIVVRGEDDAKELSDLQGYRVLFGPTDAAEKSSAPEAALRKAGVRLSKERERFGACSEAATALLAMPDSIDAAAVISSYADPLLEGCGSINKGDLRVVGKTEPVPFITAFVAEELPQNSQEELLLALITAGTDPDILVGMETLAGFVPWDESKSGSKTKAVESEKKKRAVTLPR